MSAYMGASFALRMMKRNRIRSSVEPKFVASRRERTGKIKKRDPEYVRCVTANVFCAVEPRSAKHIMKVTKRRRGLDFAQMLSKIEAQCPEAKTIHLVMYNLFTHCLKFLWQGARNSALGTLYAALHPEARKLAESSRDRDSLMPREALGRDRFPNRWHLKARVDAWNERMNQERRTIAWRFTTAKA